MALHSTVQGVGGVQPQASLRMRKRLIECIYEGGGYTRYDLQYHNMFMSVFIFNKASELGGGGGLAFFLLA